MTYITTDTVLEGRSGPSYTTRQGGPARRRATHEVLAVPEHMVAEIIDGELYASPRLARESVSPLLIVAPILRTLNVYRLEGGRWIVASTYGADDHVRAEPPSSSSAGGSKADQPSPTLLVISSGAG